MHPVIEKLLAGTILANSDSIPTIPPNAGQNGKEPPEHEDTPQKEIANGIALTHQIPAFVDKKDDQENLKYSFHRSTTHHEMKVLYCFRCITAGIKNTWRGPGTSM